MRQKPRVENQAGERAGVTECPRLLPHRRATPAVKVFVGILECKFLVITDGTSSQLRGHKLKKR